MEAHEKHGPAIIFQGKDIGQKDPEPGKNSQLTLLVGRETSKTMAVGISSIDGIAQESTLRYDEVIFVIEGTFRFVIDGVARNCHPGDVIWLPENTTLRYEGDKAKVFIVIAPVDWRERHGIT